MVTLHPNAGYCWFRRERGLTIDNLTFFGSVAGRAQGDVRVGDLQLTSFDQARGLARTVVVANHLVADDHHAPALCYLGGDALLAVWPGGDRNQLVHFRRFDLQLRPLSPVVGADAGRVVFHANVFCPPASRLVYDFYQGVGSNPSLLLSRDGGETFAYAGCLVSRLRPSADAPKVTRLDDSRPCTVYCQSGARIHFAIVDHHSQGISNSVYHGYVQDAAVFDSFGREAGSFGASNVQAATSFEALTRVFAGRPEALACVCDLAVSKAGQVAILFSVQVAATAACTRTDADGEDLRYFHASFDGHQWRTVEVAFAGSSLYTGEDQHSGQAALDPEAPLRLAFATNSDPATNAPLVSRIDGRRHHELYLAEVDPVAGAVFARPFTRDSTEDNIRPFFTRNIRGGSSALLWMAGRYSSHDDFDTQIVCATKERADTASAPRLIRVPTRPHMPDAETRALRQYLEQSSCYLEYGTGGSTFFAADAGTATIYSIDSDLSLLDEVRAAFGRRYSGKSARLITAHVDLGPTGAWGRPTDASCAARWPLYPVAPWMLVEQHGPSPDLILIDGRFRVASFLVALCRARVGALILFDDYADRSHYHVVERHCAVTGVHGRLAAFRVTAERDPGAAVIDLVRYATVPE